MGDAGVNRSPGETEPEIVSRILIAFDPSPAGERAFLRAVQIARRHKATIDVVGVAHPWRGLLGVACAAGSGYSPDRAEADQLEELHQRMRELIAAAPADVGIRSMLDAGDPRRIVGEWIDRGNYDLLVMGAPVWYDHSWRLLARRVFREIDLLVVPAA